MADLLSLPTELRGLVTYFEGDDRPCAIVHDGQEVVYQNARFVALELSRHDVQLVLKRARRADGKDVESGEHTEEVIWDRQQDWISTHVLDGWESLVCAAGSEPHSNGTRLESEQAAKSKGGLRAPKSEMADWTRSPFEVDRLSPWIQHVRAYDWSKTPLGSIDSWSVQLRMVVVCVMNTPQPRLLVWGPEQTFVYNEGCIGLFGPKHPAVLGQPVASAFAEIWAGLSGYFEQAWQGQCVTLKELPVTMQRANSEVEEKHFDFSLLPVIGDEGHVVGIIDELVDTTQMVRGKRRRDSVRNMNSMIGTVSTLKELWPAFLKGLQPAVVDVPYAIFYSVQDDIPESRAEATQKKCVLEGFEGINPRNPAVPAQFSLGTHLESGLGLVKPCLQAWKTRKSVKLHSADGSLPTSLRSATPGRAFDDEVRTAIITPIPSAVSDEMLGLLVVGLSPRSPYDEEYQLWMHIVAEMLTKNATLIALPEEQRRAQKVANDLNDTLAEQLRATTLQAERSDAKFRRMAESAPQGMYMFDAHGHTLHVNDQYLAMLGETREAHSARRPDSDAWADQVHPDDLGRFIDAWDILMQKKTPVTIEYRLNKSWKSVDDKTGEDVECETWLLANAFPDIGPDGNVIAVMGWLTDVSHRKMNENLQAQRLDEALENKRQSENFIDITSHEMRNPLSAILQSADSIVSTLTASGMPIIGENVSISCDTADEIVDAAQTIILCAQHQKRIVDDILTLSKLDASLLVISPDKVQPPVLIKKALKMYSSELVHADIDATLCVESSYRDLGVEWVILDASRLLQVIINLLTNAIKFTQYSELRQITITLGASSERPSGSHHNVNFIPIRPGRANQPVPTKADWGDGEDVYLQIAVQDSGQGLNEEDIQVLFQRFSQASPKTYKQYGGSGLGLFISRELTELLGGQIGVSIVGGRTTFTFFVKAKKCDESGGRPKLPKCVSTSASPIAYGRKGSVLLDTAPEQIQQKLRGTGALSVEMPPFGGAVQPTTNGPERQANGLLKHSENGVLHVLIVEDNIINQRVMSQQLRRAGCVVHVANHGLECLGFLEQTTFCAANTPLSVILLDLEMPTMDGLTCIRNIRERQASGRINQHIPVIAVTANARSEQISAALSAGMDQVVTKPFRIPELMPQMAALVAEIGRQKGG